MEKNVFVLPSILKEQWIRAKYERLEFSEEGNYYQQAYSSGKYILAKRRLHHETLKEICSKCCYTHA